MPAHAGHIARYAAELKAAHDKGTPHGDPGVEWSPLYEDKALAEFINRSCPAAHVEYTGARSFLQQYNLFSQVAGTEDIAFHYERSNLKGTPFFFAGGRGR